MRETERQKRWAAGSITAYLCLVLILMLSLISGTIASVRNAHARVMTACAMEQGLYSLFAGYDRTLLGQYELFFYNGGDKSGVWKPEIMSRKVAETAGEVLSPTSRPSVTFPKAAYAPSRCGAALCMMKNWLPALAETVVGCTLSISTIKSVPPRRLLNFFFDVIGK